MSNTSGLARFSKLVFCSMLAVGSTRAQDPPDAALNPVSGAIEVTDTVQLGVDSQVRYVVQSTTGGSPEAALLTDGAVDDLDPKIDIKTDGDTWVTWWRDGSSPAVFCRIRNQTDGTWSDEILLSGSGENARRPTITHDDSTTWVSYEVATSSAFQIAVKEIDDGPDPIPQATIVASTSYSGNLDVVIRSEAGHVWVSWIDSATSLKWAEYDPSGDVWSAAYTQSYASSTVQSAREAIRSMVVGD